MCFGVPIPPTVPTYYFLVAMEQKMVKKIDDISARQVTFSKRRQGLVKKAHELSILCEAEVAVLIFSPTRRLYQYSSTSNMKDILTKYAVHLDTEEQPVGFQDAKLSRVKDKIKFLRHIKTQHLQQYNVQELNQLEMKLEGVMNIVAAKKQRVLTDEAPARIKEFHNTDTSGTQSRVQETLCTASRKNSKDGMPCTAQSGVTNYPERWIPPPADVYKVNFAGRNFQSVDAPGVGIGLVIRNWRGDFMAALARFFPKMVDLNTASLMAAKCAVEFAVDYHFTDIILEGDVPNTIDGLQYAYEDNSPASTIIIQEAKSYMIQLGSCSFSRVQTSGNTAAHMVAQYARNVGNELVWLMEEPDFLADVVQMNY